MTYPWKRYWVKQGENPSMESGLFAEPSAVLRLFGPSSNGISLSELKDVPCLVLLGDVGMGKSTTIEKEAQEYKTMLAGQKHAVVYQDLKRLSEAQIERNIFHDPAVEAWLRSEHALTLFLDSLDECWRRIDALEHLLVDELKRRIRKETPPLFLRLTCRSAEWRGDAGKALERLFSKRTKSNPAVQIFVLAPLSANNVREAAASNNLDGNRLLECVAAKEAQALASHPITLEMLLQIYKQSGDFPKSRVELYQDGCLRLCADDHVRVGAGQQRKTTAQHRFAIASRLAALSVFTNRFLINDDLEHLISRVDVLEVAEAVGHKEERAGGERVIVNRDTITETLQTALFAERIEGTQAWRHQSYAEFLAAQYLSQCGLSVSQITSVLTDTTDNAQRVIPQLEETACWIAEMNSGVFQALAHTNADVFLRCDSTCWDDKDRAILAGSYLELVRRHEAAELDWQLKYRFARLAHPELVTQLRSAITNHTENPLVRESAIDIAGYCALKELAPELIDVFLDAEDIFRVRKRAAIALKQVAGGEIRTLLRQKNVNSWIGDEDDDLKGYYLHIMWPSHMSLNELLPLVASKKRNYVGSYKIFLECELPKSLSDDDLPRILDWLRTNCVSSGITADFGHLPAKLFSRAVTQMAVPSIRNIVLQLLSSDDYHLHRLFREADEPEQMSAQNRRCFWNEVVQSGLDIQKLIAYGNRHSAGMLSPEDLLAFIANYSISSHDEIRERWRMLVFRVFSMEDPGSLDALSELARKDRAIADDLAAHTSCRVLPNEHNWRKQNYEWHQERNRVEQATKPTWTERLLHALEEFEAGKFEAYWTIFELLDRDPENFHPVFTIRFSEGKAWKSLSAEVKGRILRGASVYLGAQLVDETKVWERKQRYRAYDLVNPLLVLLFDEDRQALGVLTNELWSKWVSVFLANNSRRNGSHHEAYRVILSLAFSEAQQPFLAALKRQLMAEINNDSERRIIWDLHSVWCNQIKDVFLDLFHNKPLTSTAAQDIFQLLVLNEPKEAENLLASIVDETNRAEKCSVHVPAAFIILLTNFPTTWAVRLLDWIKTDSAIGRAVVPRLIHGRHQPQNWLSEIPPQHLAEFWEWLNQHYPGDPYEKDDGSGSVTINHDIYHFRNGVFQTLRESGQQEACDAMIELMRRRPDDFWLGDILAEMRKTSHRKAWVRPSTSALMQLFAATEKRIVRTAGELHGLVLESLRRFESELHGAPPSMELWNETNEGKVKFWQPKDEKNLSNSLKRFLERDLKERGIISDREVEIRPRLGNDSAQPVDILVRAIPFGEDGRPGPPVSAVIEVKCAWNDGVLLDMKRQLYDRYIKNREMHFGVYAVAYYACDAWNWKNDARKAAGESRTAIADLRRSLSDQAASLTNSQKLVESIVIDARLSLT